MRQWWAVNSNKKQNSGGHCYSQVVKYLLPLWLCPVALVGQIESFGGQSFIELNSRLLTIGKWSIKIPPVLVILAMYGH